MIRASSQEQPGFTIVEVLVMVVIIAVLATITMFAFGSWRARTATTEVKTALTHLSAALKNELNFNSAYPATVPSTYQPSDGVTINYSMGGGGSTYCASGTSTSVSSVVWYISSSNPNPSQTSC